MDQTNYFIANLGESEDAACQEMRPPKPRVSVNSASGLGLFQILAQITFGNLNFSKLLKQILLNFVGKFGSFGLVLARLRDPLFFARSFLAFRFSVS